MRKYILIAFLCIGSAYMSVSQGAAENQVIAINVLLLPDERMQVHAHDLNSQLRRNDPSGFAFDDTHVPHISLVHQYVRSSDLPRVFEAAQRVAAKHKLVGAKVTATGIEHESWNGRELSTLSVQKTDEMANAQRELLDALRPYRSEPGGADAFIRKAGEEEIDPSTIDYVATFAEKRTGDQFKPHFTLGFSDAAFAEQLKAKEVEPFPFKIADVAVFQLGNVGTARKELWRFSKH